MITGTVKLLINDKGDCFIAPENGGGDAFVHISAVERAGMRTIDADQRISYELETDRRGKTYAINLQAALAPKKWAGTLVRAIFNRAILRVGTKSRVENEMSRAINIKATNDHVLATCAKLKVQISAIEALVSGGTRVVLNNAIDTAIIAKAYGSKVILGNVARLPTRTWQF